MTDPTVQALSYNYVVIETLDGSKAIDITNSVFVFRLL